MLDAMIFRHYVAVDVDTGYAIDVSSPPVFAAAFIAAATFLFRCRRSLAVTIAAIFRRFFSYVTL